MKIVHTNVEKLKTQEIASFSTLNSVTETFKKAAFPKTDGKKVESSFFSSAFLVLMNIISNLSITFHTHTARMPHIYYPMR